MRRWSRHTPTADFASTMRRIRRCSTWLWSSSPIAGHLTRASLCRRRSRARVRPTLRLLIFAMIQPTRCSLAGKKNLTCASLAAARVSHRPRPDFPVGESIASLLFDGIEDSAPGLPSNDVLRASRSSHQCSPISPIPPHFPGMGCSPPHIALLSGLEGTGMTGRQITDVMNSIAMQFGPVPGRLLPRCK